MEHSAKGEWDEHGCFVYKVIQVCQVRDHHNVGDDHRVKTNKEVGFFEVGDLVSVDLIYGSRFKDSQNGPFLRLSDHSGWLFERKYGDVMMERVPVEKGLWTFYADNYPAGIGLRRNPIDRSNQWMEPNTTFLPMEKIFCDRKVISQEGVIFYRVQGTNGWVFNKRGETSMMLPNTKVKLGLFAYKIISSNRIAVRNDTDIGNDYKTMTSFEPGDIVAVDAVRQSPQENSSDGPFLRLSDGKGWLFEYKNGKKCMEEIPVISGSWKFRILNSVGLAPRCHPMDDPGNENNKFNDLLGYNEECVCDHWIQGENGVNFYRVKGTPGWIFDKRDGVPTLQNIPYNYFNTNSNPENIKSWNLEYVRGIALALGLKEIIFNAESRLLSFRNDEDVRFNIYYTTRTIGTAMTHPFQGKTQMFRRNCTDNELVEVLSNPRIHTGKGYQMKRPRISLSAVRDDTEIDGELELRHSLVEIQDELKALETKKVRVLKAIESHTTKRSKEEQKKEGLRKYFELKNKEKVKQARRKRRRKAELTSRTCQKCHRVFTNACAKDQHYRDTHEFKCDVCGRICYAQNSLKQHKNATGHW